VVLATGCRSILVIVSQFDVKCIFTNETKNNAPVGSNSDGPESTQIALKGMQMVAGEIQRLRCRGLIETT